MKTRFFHNESWEESSGAAVINENSLAYAILSHNPPVMRFTCLFLFFALLSAAHAAPTPPENHSAAAPVKGYTSSSIMGRPLYKPRHAC
ncbi:hypothetical protein LENED_009275 [Lentinula edodes]|uniref:Uncharacterized protein n=1 Tax=Lentinula edodes TaxID=5353 RepID=A0A1Q3EJ97_LENED|nr:hypothetical protein LENED_009275 [Lentinula edodes]